MAIKYFNSPFQNYTGESNSASQTKQNAGWEGGLLLEAETELRLKVKGKV